MNPDSALPSFKGLRVLGLSFSLGSLRPESLRQGRHHVPQTPNLYETKSRNQFSGFSCSTFYML